MLTKSIVVIALAVFLGTTAAVVAQGWQGSNGYYSPYELSRGASRPGAHQRFLTSQPPLRRAHADPYAVTNFRQ